MTRHALNRRALVAGLAAAAAIRPAHADQVAYPGGRGGRILRVTTLKPDGPGSILEAIKASGRRIIVFEVGGVIDLDLGSVRISRGDLTIAGQTAPSLVTFVRGGLEIGQGARNVVIQHVAVRPGEAGRPKTSGWECDGIYSYGAAQVEVSNCSITWSTDEGLSASGKRFGADNRGSSVDDWRAQTSHGVRFLRNLVAEGLSNSTHSKGEHSKGTLIHDNVRDVVIADSLYAHNRERNVLFKGGAQGEMAGNVVYNAGKRFTHYNLHANEWEGRPHEQGEVRIRRNVYLAGPSTDPDASAFMFGGEGPLELDMSENLMLDARGAPLKAFATFGSGGGALRDLRNAVGQTSPADVPDLRAMMARVLDTCGARPWERDPIDARIVADVRQGTGRIIDSEQDVGGYPARPETRAPFVEADWDLDTMTRRS